MQVGKIVIHEGDDPKKLVADFQAKYGMRRGVAEHILECLSQQLEHVGGGALMDGAVGGEKALTPSQQRLLQKTLGSPAHTQPPSEGYDDGVGQGGDEGDDDGSLDGEGDLEGSGHAAAKAQHTSSHSGAGSAPPGPGNNPRGPASRIEVAGGLLHHRGPAEFNLNIDIGGGDLRTIVVHKGDSVPRLADVR